MYDIECTVTIRELDKLAVQIFGRHWNQLDWLEMEDIYCYIQDMAEMHRG